MTSTKKRRIILPISLIFVLLLASNLASAGGEPNTSMAELCEALYIVAGFLASLMFVLQGVRWIMSESPQDRMEAKKAIMYIIIGLLVVYMAAILVSTLYCNTLKNYDPTIDCSLEAIGGCNAGIGTPGCGPFNCGGCENASTCNSQSPLCGWTTSCVETCCNVGGSLGCSGCNNNQVGCENAADCGTQCTWTAPNCV
ncbi:pilin [Candidatus Altiarchaeota archaeon]